MQVDAQPPLPEKLVNRNRPERVEWFRNAGFGLFIHWSVDGQLGTVISHSLVGASEDYVKRYFEELPKTFNPKKFDPSTWAVQAKLAGFKYVVFTTKHHNGFCMYDSKTTDFDVASTPFRRDITAEVVQAFRAQGIGIGFYFSPGRFPRPAPAGHHHRPQCPRGRAQEQQDPPGTRPGPAPRTAHPNTARST